jgi:hypothetical protein
MTIMPVLIFLTAIGCAIVFEYVYGFFARRWILPVDKELCVLLYWIALFMLGVLCRVIPVPAKGVSEWAPILFVALVHLFVSTAGSGIRLPSSPPSSPSSGTASSTSSKPSSFAGKRDVDKDTHHQHGAQV